MHTLLAKLRIAGATGKEVLEGVAQLDDRHLRRVLRDFQHPRKLLALDGVQLAAQGRLCWFGLAVVQLPRLVLAFPFSQCPVVGEAGRASGTRHVGGLHVVQIECNAMGNQHWDSSTAFFTPSRSF